MFVSDESSSVPDEYYTMASTWANRIFAFGNTWPCDNFFRKGVKAGDLTGENGAQLRRVVRIKATDSPNVRLALAEIANGKQPSHEMLVPGVKDYREYLENRLMWDRVHQCVSLDAEFYEGAEVLMYPPEWLNAAEDLARSLIGKKRIARGIGVDPAEGGDSTAMVAVDEHGLIELVSKKTRDTNVIVGDVMAFARKHGVLEREAHCIAFDAGGGKPHADRMRAAGWNVQVVPFGGAVIQELRKGGRTYVPFGERRELREEKYLYKNRRAQMYHELHLKLELDTEGRFAGRGFAIPQVYTELRRQMAVVPKLTDDEGRYYMLPKKTDDDTKDSLVKLIGHSPDEMDALVLANYAMDHKPAPRRAGAA
jgi:hypothetical protein